MRRHGEVSPEGPTLAFREAFLKDMREKPVPWTGHPVLEGRSLEDVCRDGGSDVRSPVLWWSVSAARLLAAFEAWPPIRAAQKEVESWLLAERRSHEAILKEILEALQLAPLPEGVFQPHWAKNSPLFSSRWMRGAVAHGAATAKVVVTTLLFEQALRVFSAQPAFAERLRQYLQEILVDESGYVHYLRSQLSDAQLLVARRLFPMFANHLVDRMPELVTLVGKMRVKEEVARARIYEIRQDMPRTSGVFRSVA
jgi:hypothetical protein